MSKAKFPIDTWFLMKIEDTTVETETGEHRSDGYSGRFV